MLSLLLDMREAWVCLSRKVHVLCWFVSVFCAHELYTSRMLVVIGRYHHSLKNNENKKMSIY